MKKALLTLSVALAIGISTNAQSLIHYWHFNNITAASHNPGIPALKANVSLLDTNKATIVYKLSTTNTAYAGYIDNVTGTDSNARMSTAAGNGLRVRNPSDSMELRFYIPTTGYKNISLKYAAQCSSLGSGMLAQLFDYSTDSGATWVTTGLNTLVDSVKTAIDPAWKIININFGTTTTVNNTAKLVFRIKFWGNTALTSGNNRFDNVTVEGDALTSVPNCYGLPQQSMIYPNPAKEQVTISMPLAGVKSITFINETGAVVSKMQTAETQLPVNVSGLTAGNYFILVNNNTTNTTEQIRFLKQ